MRPILPKMITLRQQRGRLMAEIRVMVADDHPIFLEGLCTVLPLEDPELVIVGTAANGSEAVELEKMHSPDVVLLDIKMPLMNGVEAARQMIDNNADVKIIMLTTFDDLELIEQALQAGAKGYILKDTPVKTIVSSIHTVYEGNVLLSEEVARKLIDSVERDRAAIIDEDKTTLDSGTAVDDANNLQSDVPGCFYELSAKEKAILEHMVSGKSNPEIAEELYLSEKTVRNYISHIYDILGVNNRTQAVLWAVKYNIGLNS